MTQEDKELLLRDLCGRLPYVVKIYDTKNSVNIPYMNLCHINGIVNEVFISSIMLCRAAPIEDIKPYLFPLSSMTKKQKEEYEDALVYHNYVAGGWTIAKTFNDEYIIPYWFVDFCNKNHFDYRGLIGKGLAIDATGLNIY